MRPPFARAHPLRRRRELGSEAELSVCPQQKRGKVETSAKSAMVFVPVAEKKSVLTWRERDVQRAAG